MTKPNPENCTNCSHLCAYHCAQLSYTTQHGAVLIIFSLNLQISITAQILSIGWEGHCSYSYSWQAYSAGLHARVIGGQVQKRSPTPLFAVPNVTGPVYQSSHCFTVRVFICTIHRANLDYCSAMPHRSMRQACFRHSVNDVAVLPYSDSAVTKKNPSENSVSFEPVR